MKKVKFFIFLPFLFASFFTLNNSSVFAQGNLLITPRRVVFEGSKRTEELNLANTGTDTAKYVVSFVQYRMNGDGSMTEITEPDSGQNFADKYLRFFPRNVVLAPGEAQVVRVQLTKTNELQPGEYRSHIYFRAVPNEKPLGEAGNKADTSSLIVRLTPIFGITIPAIIRVGESDTKVDLTNVMLIQAVDTVPVVSITLQRSGNFSVYGDITVNYVSPEGTTTQIGLVKGIAVYTPNKYRVFHMAVDTKNIDLHKGKIVVTYATQSDLKPVRLAEKEIVLH